MKFLPSFNALILVFLLVAGYRVQAQTTQTFPSGSYIIDMGVTPQTYNNGLKPYGLVYALLQAGVPVSWSINSTKGKDGIDFSHNGKNYRGGPFIVPGEYKSVAQSIINTFVANSTGTGTDKLTVDVATSSFSAPIYSTLRTAPRWILDAKNGSIAQGYIINAGISAGAANRPNYSFKDPENLNSCDDIYVMPHADPTWVTHNNLFSWNLASRGAIWAACHAVSALENAFNTANPSEQMNFLSTKTGTATGGGPFAASPGNSLILWGSHSGGTLPPAYEYDFHNEPVMQFLGLLDNATQNGSEQIYIPTTKTASQWRTTTKVSVWDDSQPDISAGADKVAAKVAFGPGFGDANRGKVMYEAGHSHAKGTAPENVAAQRAFLNFSLWATQDKAIQVTSSNIPTSINGGATSGTFSGSITAPAGSGPFTYQWTSASGGSFSNASGTFSSAANAATATATTFTAPAAPTASFNNPIFLKIQDACGRETIFSASPRVLSTPVAPVANLDTKTIKPETVATITPLANDTDGNLDVLTVKGLGLTGSTTLVTTSFGQFALGPNNTVLYKPNPGFVGRDSVIYAACDPGPLCDTAFIKITVAPEVGPCGPGFTQIVLGTGNANSYNPSTVVSVSSPQKALGAPDGSYAELDLTGTAAFTLDLGRTFSVGDTIKLRLSSRAVGTGPNQFSIFKVEGATAIPFNFTNAAVSIPVPSTLLKDYIFVVSVANTRYIRLQNTSTYSKGRVDGVTFPIRACIPVCAADQTTTKATKYAASVFTQTGINSPTSSLNAPDQVVAAFDKNTDILVLDMGEVIPQNSTIAIFMNLSASTSTPGTIAVSASTSGTGPFTGSTTFTVQSTQTAFTTYAYQVPSGGARYLQFTGWTGSKDIQLDAVKFVSVKCTSVSPVAVNDTLTICEDNYFTFNPLVNDSDPNGSALTVRISSPPINGWAAVNGDGTITYTPKLDYSGTDQITYTACNSLGFCSTAKIFINIPDDNCPSPGIYKQMQVTTVNRTLSGTTDTDDTWLDAQNPSNNNGTNPLLQVDSESSQPNRSLIKFQLSSIPAGAVITSATLTLTKTNARTDVVQVFRATSAWVEGTKNAATAATGEPTWAHRQHNTVAWTTAPGGDFSTAQVVEAATTPSITIEKLNWNVKDFVQSWVKGATPNHGFLLKSKTEPSGGNNFITFHSSEAVNAADRPTLSITYQITDCSTAACAPIPNRPPIAMRDDTCTSYNTAVTYNVARNDRDADDNLNATSVQRLTINGYPKYGVASGSGSNITYTPNTGSTKTDTVYYRIFDTGSPALSDTSMLVICVGGVPITAVNDNATTRSDYPVSINVASNDNNPVGGVVSISSQPGYPPSNGTIAIVEGQIEYTPNPGFTGVDKFEYTICNSNFPPSCSSALVTVTVMNQPPVTANDTITTQACTPVTIDVLANDYDPEGNDMLVISVGTPNPTGKGTFSIQNNKVIFSPNNTFTSGSVSIPYTVQDDGVTSQTATGTILINFGTPPPNAPPLAVKDEFDVNTGAVLYADVLSNDSDPDGDMLRAKPTISVAPTRGTASVLNNGLIVYTPTNGYVGKDSLRYQICDSITASGSCVRTPNCSLAWAVFTVNFVELPKIGAAKTVTTPVSNGDGSFNITYTIRIENMGNVLMNNVQIHDTLSTVFPSPVTYSIVGLPTSSKFSVNPAFTGSGANTGLLAGSQSLALGDNGTVSFTVKVTPGSNPGPYNNNAFSLGYSPTAGRLSTDRSTNGTAVDPDLDGNPSNNSTPTPVTFPTQADLGITKTDNSATYTPGTTVTYTIVVSNAGPSTATGATVTDNAPAGTSITSWSAAFAGGATGTASGTGNISQSVDIPNGGTATYTVNLAVPAGFTGNLVNTATVTAPAGFTDPNTANNSATDTNTPNPRADLAITKTDGLTSVAPGNAVTYTIVVTNNGPSNVTGATVTDNLPAALTNVSWSSATAGTASVSAGATGTGNSLAATVNIPAGAGNSVTFTVTGTVAPGATGTLSNTATVTAPAGTTDPTQGNNNATDNTTLTPTANLGITKTDGSATYTPGTTVTYTVVVSNAGPSTATGATVTDNAPDGTSITSWSAAFAGGATGTASGSGNISQTVTVPSGGTATYTINLAVPAGFTGSLANTATITAPAGTTDPNTANNTATDTDTQNSQADLAITKTDGVTSAIPGNQITYTIVVTNNGPSNVTGATVTDNIPATITGVSWSSATAGTASVSAGATGSGNSLSAAVNLPAGAGNSVTFTVTGTVAPGATGTLTNTATVTAPAGTTDPTPGNNSATDNTTLTPTADLAITKTDGLTSAIPGNTLTYTIVVTNNGPSNVTGATVTDNLPAALTNVSWSSATAGTASVSAGATGSGNSLAATVSIPAGAGNSVTFTVTGTVAPGATGTLTNTASVAPPAGTTDPTPGNNSATDNTTLTPTADLAITKTDGLTSAIPGNAVTYTIVVTNNGPSNVTGATVTDNLPAALTNVSWSSATAGTASVSAGATGSGNSLAATVSIPAGAGNSVTFTVTGTVAPGATGTLSNTASVAPPAGTTDPTQGNNSATDNTTLTPTADLAITKTDGSATYTPGTTVTYTVVVSNAGPSTATGATVTDNAPDGTSIISWSAAFAGGATGTASGTGNISQSVNVPTGGTATYTINLAVPAGFTGNLVNTATVTAPAGATDPSTANNTATDTNTPDLRADLAITKTDGSTTYTPGSPITYTIVVTNNGPSNVSGATIADAIPTAINGVSWSSTTQGTATVSSGGTGTGNSLDAIVSLPTGAGNSVTFTVTGIVAPSATGNLANTATVTAPAGVTDPTPTNNTATDTNTPDPRADLAITKTDGLTSVAPGNAVTYTIVVTNNGPSNVTGATVTDNLPAALTNVSWSSATAGTASVSAGATGSGNSLAATVNIPAGAGNSVTFTVTGTVAPGATGTLTNTASVAPPAGTTDPTQGNNSATDNTTLTPTTDLAITKTVNNQTPNVGSDVVFTLVVTNNGPSDATEVVVTDVIPSGYTYITDDGAGAYIGGTGKWTVGNLPKGATATLNITATVKASGNYTNSATVTGAGTDPQPGNNTDSATPVPVPVADLSITKSDSKTTYTPGTTVTYTVTVNNAGPSSAVGANIIDNAPTGTSISSWSAVFAGGATGTASGTGNINQVANVPLGSSITYTVNVAVPSGHTGPLANTATVTAPTGTTDPNTGNNSATDTDTQNSIADLGVIKSVSNATPSVGSNVTFTLTVTNNGPSNATGVSLTDQLPTGYQYVSDNGGGAYVSETGVWTIGTLAKGASVSLEVTALVNASGSYTNTATVSGSLPDPNAGNNSASITTVPVPQADLAISKSVNTTNPNVGSNVTFTVSVTNNGLSDATGVSVSDQLPSGYTYVSDNGGGAYNNTTGIWNIGNLANNASVSLEIVAMVKANGDYVNRATVGGNQQDPNTGNNSATSSAIPTAQVDLSMTKMVNNTTPDVGTNVVFTLTVRNQGPSNATGVVVTDALPSGYTYVSDNGSGAYNSATGQWTVGALSNTQSITLLITAKVNPTGNYTNTALASANEQDPNMANNSSTVTPTPVPVTDLAVSKTNGSDTYTPGNPVSYTITVTNAGPSNVVGATVADIIPGDLINVSWTSSVTGTASISSGATGSGNSLSALVNINAGAANSVVFVVTGTARSSATGTLTNTVMVTAPSGTKDPAMANNTATDSDSPQIVADLAITKSNDTTSYTPGTATTYEIVVSNTGPSDAVNTLVTDSAPAGTTITGWTATMNGGATGSGIGSGNLSETVTLPSGGSIVYTVTLAVSSAYTGDLTNTATVTPPAGTNDPNPANNTASDTDTAMPVADLSITKSNGSNVYTPGATTTYTIVAGNAGPSDVFNATITDNIPAGTTWSYTATGTTGTNGYAASGTGNINDLATIPAGGQITYEVTVTIPANFTGDLTNTATVSPPAGTTDPDPVNNSATDSDTRQSVADLAVTTTDGVTSYTPGTSTTYTVVVSNAGPSGAAGAIVTNNAPAGTTITGWSASFAGGASGNTSGSGPISEIVTLPRDGSITYTLTVAIPSGYTGNLVNTATVSAPVGVIDPNIANNSASDTDTPNRIANLGITKTDGATTYTPGTTTTYTIVVSNAGPSDVLNAAVIDNIPSGATWTYTSTGTTGTSGNTASGTTHIGDLVSIPVGGTITYTVTLTAPSSFTGNLVNKATITAPAGTTDPENGNNSATDTNTQNSQADLSITNSDGVNTYTPGTPTSYKVVVKNAGPSNAIGALVNNPAPAGTTITGWSAAFGVGAAGTATGNGDINQIVSITAGDSITYTVMVSIPASYTGNLVNQASVAPPAGLTDTTPANNSATDTDTPNRVADLSLTKTNGSTSYTPGTTTTYTLVAANAGPSDVVGATVVDAIPAGITWSYTSTGTAGTSGNAAGGNGSINDLVTIPAGGKITYTVMVTIPADYTGNLSNVATVTVPANTTDPNPGNNSATDTDTQSSSTDLAVVKSIAAPRPEAGAQVTFSLLVTNNGPSAATGVKVNDLLPTGYTYVSHTGSGTYTSGTGLWDIGNLALNGTASMQIVATINSTGEYTNTATVSGDQNDPVTANNQSSAGVQQQLLLPKVYLQGALFGITFADAPANNVIDSLMRDDLRSLPSFPTTSPYSYWNPTVAANTILPAVLTANGPDAIVDWVFVELRSAANPATVVSGRSALLQRDGDIVNLDGTSPLDYRAVAGATYYVTVRHRNHLAVMTASPLALTTAGLVVDFRQPSTLAYLKGASAIHKARVDVLQGRAMWAGNTLRDGKVVYQGNDNDVNVVSQQVINAAGNTGMVPFYILSGYHNGDVNLNGKVIFQGFNNDVEFIYQNVIKNHPGNTQKDNFFVIQEQLPNNNQ